MKHEKIFLFIMAIIMMASCDDDNPVAVNNYFDTLPTILDGNWREVTDIDSTVIVCVSNIIPSKIVAIVS